MKRKTTYGLNSLVMVCMVIGILAIINFIATKHYQRIDFTKEKRFSLAPQSIKVVKALKDEVKVIGFFKSQDKPLFDDLLSKYKYHTKKVVTQFVDPDEDVTTAKRYNVKRYKTIIVEQGKRESRIEELGDENGEEKLTNAIIKVGKEKITHLYFLSGHDEKSIKEPGREGYSVVHDELKGNGYDVQDLPLIQRGEIPKDCDVLIIPGPQKPFLPKEVELIESYLKKGGDLLLMIDPMEKRLGIEALVEKVGIHFENDFVVDPISTLFGQGAATPVISEYGNHVMVREMKLASFYPLARSITIAKDLPVKSVAVEGIAKTSPNSWGETGSLKSTKVQFDKDKDKKGPLFIGAAASGKWGESEMRLVVWGDSDFADNRSFGFSGNGNFFQNAVAWLSQDETSISIRPNAANAGKFIMTPMQVRWVFIITVVLVPLSIILFGIGVWWFRRKLA